MSFKDSTSIALSLGLALSGEVKMQDIGTAILLVLVNQMRGALPGNG